MNTLRIWFREITPVKLLLLGIVVGVGGAFGAVLFHSLISLINFLLYGNFSGDFISKIELMPVWQRILIPTVGGLLVGIIFRLTKVNEAEGEGVPEVVEALSHQHGKIRPVVAPVKILAAAITIGSGGSAGREGPAIQIGSAIGSGLAQFLSLAEKERSLLLAAGAAAAIGGTFGAPLAGVVFTIEILRQRPSIFRFFVIMIAAFVGQFGARLILGNESLNFEVADFLFTPWLIQILVAVALGALAAIIALIFGEIILRSRFVFSKLPIAHLWQPALGGLLIGLIGLYLPYIHEQAAYPLMAELVTLAALPVGFLLVILVVKMIATGITLGSGGVGGIFAPSLLLGTILGSIVGGLMLGAGIITIEQMPLFVLVGMASVFAAAAHAPITATLIMYEMTDLWELIPALLVSTLVAAILIKLMKKESIYDIHVDR